MDLHLAGKRALVTGSSQGIGEAIAKVLAREGAFVVVHGRNEERANRVASAITAAGGQAAVVLGDVATDEGAASVCARAVACAGGIDILINNAGAYRRRAWQDVTATDWADTFNCNVISAVRMVAGLAPQMKELGWGRIIQMTSSIAVRPLAVMPDYSAAKAALFNATASLAFELAGSGITVNAVAPGLVASAATRAHIRQDSGERPAADRRDGGGAPRSRQPVVIALGRPGAADEVASLVTFLCSPLADYIHGAMLPIDGGYIGPIL